MNDYVDKLWNSDAVACLDALKEADEAVETINRDMFSIIADVAADVVADGSNDNPSAVLKDTLKEFEKRYKRERNLKHMPGSYRSAKSTIVNAVKHGINLYDEVDDKLKGKSALEKEINQVKKQPKDARTDKKVDDQFEFMDSHLDEAFTSVTHALTAECINDEGNVKMYIDRIREKLDSIDERLEKE